MPLDRKFTIIPTVKSVDPPDIVVVLQDLLEQARAGEITELVGATVSEDGYANYLCVGVSDAFRFLGLMQFCIHSLAGEFVEGE